MEAAVADAPSERHFDAIFISEVIAHRPLDRLLSRLGAPLPRIRGYRDNLPAVGIAP